MFLINWKKNKNKKIFFLFLFIATKLCSQTWVENYITNYLSNTYVNNIGVTDSTLWFNGNGLIKFDGLTFKHYNLTNNSFGNINKYISTDVYGSEFDMITNDNVVCLYDYIEGRILKIENDFIYNYSNKMLKHFFTNLVIDHNHDIWAVIYDEDKGSQSISNAENSHIYKISFDDIERYYLPVKYDTLPINSLNFFNDIKIITLYKREGIIKNYLLVVLPNNIIKEYELNPYVNSNYGYKFYSDNNSAYLLSADGDLYHIKKNGELEIINIPEMRLRDCFDFIIVNNYIFMASDEIRNGKIRNLVKYDLINKEMNYIPLSIDYFSFLNMVIYKNWIIGSFANCSNLTHIGVGALRID